MHKDGHEPARGRRVRDMGRWALPSGAWEACGVEQWRLARDGGQGVGYPHCAMARERCERAGTGMGGMA